jgi:hypothetical protein
MPKPLDTEAVIARMRASAKLRAPLMRKPTPRLIPATRVDRGLRRIAPGRRLPSSPRPGQIAHRCPPPFLRDRSRGPRIAAKQDVRAYPTKHPQPVEADIRPLGGNSRFDPSGDIGCALRQGRNSRFAFLVCRKMN